MILSIYLLIFLIWHKKMVPDYVTGCVVFKEVNTWKHMMSGSKFISGVLHRHLFHTQHTEPSL